MAETKKTVKKIETMVKEVNAFLEKHEPEDISFDDFSGYTGYKPQYIIDGMNASFGIGNWGFEVISANLHSDGALAVAKVSVWIGSSTPTNAITAFGQSRVTRGDIGDAMKGAQTDAIKKALSYFSIGGKAYRGELEAPKGSVKKAPAATRAAASPKKNYKFEGKPKAKYTMTEEQKEQPASVTQKNVIVKISEKTDTPLTLEALGNWTKGLASEYISKGGKLDYDHSKEAMEVTREVYEEEMASAEPVDPTSVPI